VSPIPAPDATIPFLDIDDEELTDDQLREKYAPIRIGPTWKKNPDGSWYLPERTLGWQVVAWVTRYVRDPNDPEGKKPFIFTPEQLRFTLWWYAVDEQGEFRYRAGNLVRVKGWG